MDEEDGMSRSMSLNPAAEGALAQRSILDEIQALRAQINTQTQSIDSLRKALTAQVAESNQNTSAIAHIQAELCNLAKHLAGQGLEERFEALRCEVSSELLYLRSVPLHSPSPGPSALYLPSSSFPHPVNLQGQAGLSHFSQELYHSRRILWEQIGQLREEMHNIQYQLSKSPKGRRATETD